MKVHKLLSIFLFITGICCLQCECKKIEPFPANTEPNTLPPITTEGKNTFGFLVDGKIWLPKGTIMIPTVQGSWGGGYFNISANRKMDNTSSISIIINQGVTDTGEYELNFNNSLDGQAFFYNELSPSVDSNFYWADSLHIGKLNLLRADTYILSGTFEFEAYNKFLNKAVKITKGRFDIHYRN